MMRVPGWGDVRNEPERRDTLSFEEAASDSK